MCGTFQRGRAGPAHAAGRKGAWSPPGRGEERRLGVGAGAAFPGGRRRVLTATGATAAPTRAPDTVTCVARVATKLLFKLTGDQGTCRVAAPALSRGAAGASRWQSARRTQRA